MLSVLNLETIGNTFAYVNPMHAQYIYHHLPHGLGTPWGAPQEVQSLLRLNLSYIEPTSAGPAEILPQLFLGSRDDAVNLKVLKALGITHVLFGSKIWQDGMKEGGGLSRLSMLIMS